MRTINYTNRFKRDYKRALAGRHGKTLEADLRQVLNLLASDVINCLSRSPHGAQRNAGAAAPDFATLAARNPFYALLAIGPG
jgi:hypothetical protein